MFSNTCFALHHCPFIVTVELIWRHSHSNLRFLISHRIWLKNEVCACYFQVSFMVLLFFCSSYCCLPLNQVWIWAWRWLWVSSHCTHTHTRTLWPSQETSIHRAKRFFVAHPHVGLLTFLSYNLWSYIPHIIAPTYANTVWVTSNATGTT